MHLNALYEICSCDSVALKRKHESQSAHLAQNDLPLPFHVKWLHIVEQKHGHKLGFRQKVHLSAPCMLCQAYNPKVVTDGEDPSIWYKMKESKLTESIKIK